MKTTAGLYSAGDTVGIMKEIGVGILGFGTVGAAVVAGLRDHADLLAQRAGVQLAIRKIADLDLTTDRGVPVDPEILTTDAAAVVNDPNIDLIVELMGGTGAARDMQRMALGLRKPVVTANKALLAEHGAELYRMAAESNTDLYFGAAVGGGIPIVRVMREALTANRVQSIYGILNGTCNYILSRMENEWLLFDTVLDAAQKAGYAEAEPSLDIDGYDTAHKAVILASLMLGRPVAMDAVHVEGIRGLSDQDLRYALDMGYRIKMLAIIKRVDTEIAIRIHPTLIPLGHLLAQVGGVYNAVVVEGDMVGQSMYYGRGAGGDPTAGTVLADMADAARNLVFGASRRVMPAMLSETEPIRYRAIADVVTRHYCRATLLDHPGVLGRITQALGNHGISIASVMQKELSAGAHVPVVIVTHEAREGDVAAALHEIDAMDAVGAPTVRLRIEDLGESE